MLSALGDEPDRILGLELGASYYLAKPCSAREVLATVRAALRTRVRFESEAPRWLPLSTRVIWSSLRSSANGVPHVDDRRVQPTSWRH
ncbi:hypothetical protein OKW76_05085 [Sphingomonas sp. S1-29]|uniref:hypothetical protein n=1 Tax=Sphingomonas sp. S1-29 TaxID=2991074 RepID=UPI00223F6BEF|nr:hypothetical protein [Sphingomonas sp. S1-29]UZK70993.1 hypothetical protein OKW76_05085 [Sphingomonas sp. S1-29]